MLPSPTANPSNLNATITQSRKPSTSMTSSPNVSSYTSFTSPKLSTISTPGIAALAISRKRTSSVTNIALSRPSSLETSSLLACGSFGAGAGGAHELQLERDFCKDFWCCGLVLTDLHALNAHIQAAHPELRSVGLDADEAGAAAMAVGLDALFLDELIPGGFRYCEGSDGTAVETESGEDGMDRTMSPRQLFFTPPTSISPEMSPKQESERVGVSAAGATGLSFGEEVEPFAFPFEEENFFGAGKLVSGRRDSRETLRDEEGGHRDVDDLLAFDDVSEESGSLFEDSAIGADILNRMESIGLTQEELGIDRSLALLLLQCDFESSTSSQGPLLTSTIGEIESTSPPVAPTVRFGPLNEETFSSSSISLADIYRETEGPATILDLADHPMTLKPQVYDYESLSDMSFSEDSSDEDLNIHIESWESSPRFTPALPELILHRSSEPMFKVPEAPAHTQSAPMPSLKLRLPKPSSATPARSSNRSRSSNKCTKKMRVGSLPVRGFVGASARLAVPASQVTASSPVLTPPHAASTGFTNTRRKSGRVIAVEEAGLLDISVEVVNAGAAAGKASSALTRSIVQAQKAELRLRQVQEDDGDVMVGMEEVMPNLRRLRVREGEEEVKSSMGEENALAVFATPAAKEAGEGLLEELEDDDVYLPSARKRKGAIANRKTKKDEAITASFVVADPVVASLPLSVPVATLSKKASSLGDPAKLAAAKAAAKAARAANAEANAAAAHSRKAAAAAVAAAAREAALKLDPDFVRKFKSRAVAEQAALTKGALANGSTLAELVIDRLPKVKEGEEKRLKLGSLSILDPDSAEKRFFCPVCKKEYKNANGLKYHLNHSHTKPNELPEGYYFGKKKKEAEDMSKPFVCPISTCGKRYKNLNGLKYHTEHGHVPGEIAAAEAVSPHGSDVSEEESGEE
ncbi:hypothetical protein BC830DRAFT_1120216 [Chytriomyces sp. MP71]|nr:hypothetical protein BC830DRAFT_1120216 [Chytriomyces sp. MP71]